MCILTICRSDFLNDRESSSRRVLLCCMEESAILVKDCPASGHGCFGIGGGGTVCVYRYKYPVVSYKNFIFFEMRGIQYWYQVLLYCTGTRYDKKELVLF